MQDRVYPRLGAAGTEAQVFAAYPLAQLATAFALGILGAFAFPFPLLVPISIAALATMLALIALLWPMRIRPVGLRPVRMRLASLFLTVAMFFLGWSLAVLEKNGVPRNQLRRLLDDGAIAVGQPVELTGVLERDPESAPERSYLFLRVERIRFKHTERDVSGEVVLLAPVAGKLIRQEFEHLDLGYGARIRVMTMLERTDSFRNPGVSSFTEYLDRKGYDATGFVKSPLLIERLENTRVFLPLRWLYEWRRRLQAEIDSRFSSDTAGVLDATLLGNRYNLSHSTSERFREGGTFHVLVISGLHITFLGGLAARSRSQKTHRRWVCA